MIRVYLHRSPSNRISTPYEVLAYGYRRALAPLEVYMYRTKVPREACFTWNRCTGSGIMYRLTVYL
jgi:hypothetical protein